MMQSPNPTSFSIISLGQTESTNEYLKDICQQSDLKDLTTVVTRFQSSGKGQRGNSWEAEAGKNLLFSTVLHPTFLEARKQFLLSQIISLAVKEELDLYTTGISIKWPNDIYWKNKKICGMLIENDLAGIHISQSVAGIGINLNQEVFVSSAPNPVSLKQITGAEYNCTEVLLNLLTRIKAYYNLLQKGETSTIASRYQKALYRSEGTHTYKDADGPFNARMVGVEADGHLMLQDDTDKIRRYVFKEVEYVF